MDEGLDYIPEGVAEGDSLHETETILNAGTKQNYFLRVADQKKLELLTGPVTVNLKLNQAPTGRTRRSEVRGQRSGGQKSGDQRLGAP